MKTEKEDGNLYDKKEAVPRISHSLTFFGHGLNNICIYFYDSRHTACIFSDGSHVLKSFVSRFRADNNLSDVKGDNGASFRG